MPNLSISDLYQINDGTIARIPRLINNNQHKGENVTADKSVRYVACLLLLLLLLVLSQHVFALISPASMMFVQM